MDFWTALQFLTILPTPRREITAANFGRSLSYFPLVGLVLGAILLLLNYGLTLILPFSVVSVLLIIALVLLTGAHHLDGFVDTCDGVLVTGKTREERLVIMSDHQVGAFGIAGAVLLLLLKYVSLSSASLMPALVLMPTLSRWAMVSAIFAFPYAKSSGMGLAFKQGANWQRFAISTIIPLAVSVTILGLNGIALLAALWLAIFGIASYFRSRLGGLTGDTYGAVNELSEVLVLLLVILLWRL